MSAKAEAEIRPGTQCALCILGDVTTNNSDYLVIGSGGSMAIGGNVDAGPNGVFNASPVSVAGTVTGGEFPSGYTHVSSVPDPFASMPLPLATSNPATFPARTDPCASVAGGGGQGVYGAIGLPNGPCTLQPGIYVITGAWTAGNNTALTSNGGVTLYVKATGSLQFKNGAGGITAMTSGPTAGFVLIADRDATAPIELQGNGGTALAGQVYTPTR